MILSIARQFLPAVDDPIVLMPGPDTLHAETKVVVRLPTMVIIKVPNTRRNMQPDEYYKIEVTQI